MTCTVEIVDRYFERSIELDPVLGTMLGDPSAATRLPDFSPAGIEEVADLERETLQALREVAPADAADRRARDVLAETLECSLEHHELGEPLRALRNFGSPAEHIRVAFDLMPHSDAGDWPAVVERMALVPGAVAGVVSALREGQRRGIVAARRQAGVVAEQARSWGGADGGRGYFTRLVADDSLPQPLAASAAAAATAAEVALIDLATYLEMEYTPLARDSDPVGRDAYAVWSRYFNGIELDPEATYEWGWEELQRLNAEIEATANLIAPGLGYPAVRELLNTDPARAIEGVDNFRQWLQQLTDTAVDALDGTHFIMSPEARRIECMIAPPGGAAAMYYTPPTEDWSRPGRTWYPAGDHTTFPTWEEVSTAYHEGVPGHHLQFVAVRLSKQSLTRFQTNHFNSGHGEGWALYAERLMDELGFHEQPETRLGMLTASAFRAARVVLDIGLHLQLRIPSGQAIGGGQVWTHELACEFLSQYAGRGDRFVSSEVDRYLGMPGQAISYKVGEREWLDIREELRHRQGAAFDLRTFHAHALDIGPMGLAQLRRELLQGS